MADINPAEVSAILKKQLEGHLNVSSMNEVGTVLEVGDGIARVYGLSNAQYGDCLLYTSPSPRDLSTSRMPSSA